MRHMMIDFETLATTPNAHVLTLGWCVFDPRDTDIIESGVYRFADDQPRRTISVSTVMWWLAQSTEAQAGLLVGEPACFSVVLSHLRNEYRNYGCEAMWSMGPSFDGAIIESIARDSGNPPVCGYNHHRDVRTIGMLANEKFKNTKGVAHDARSDAIEQAFFVQHCYRKLGLV